MIAPVLCLQCVALLHASTAGVHSANDTHALVLEHI